MSRNIKNQQKEKNPQFKKGQAVISDPDLVPAFRRTYMAARSYMEKESSKLHAEDLMKARKRSQPEYQEPDFKVVPCSMPDVIRLLYNSPFDSENWHRDYATISEQVGGTEKVGNRRFPCVVIMHGGGILSGLDGLKDREMEDCQGFPISEFDLGNLLRGKASGSNGIKFYSWDDFKDKYEIEDKRYAIVLTHEQAMKPANSNSEDLFVDTGMLYNHPLFVSRAGSVKNAHDLLEKVVAFYTQKEFTLDSIKYGNIHGLGGSNPNHPQVRFLHIRKPNGHPGIFDFHYTPKGEKDQGYNLFLVKYPAQEAHSQKPADIAAVFKKALAQKPNSDQQPDSYRPNPGNPPASPARDQSFAHGRGLAYNLDSVAETSQAAAPQREPRHPGQITQGVTDPNVSAHGSFSKMQLCPERLGAAMMDQMSMSYGYKEE